MRSEFLLRHRVSVASILVVVAAVIAVVVYVLAVPGYASHRAEINDGGVWVTKGATGQFGRLNKPIGQLDGYAYTEKDSSSYDIDIAQQGASVLAIDHSGGALYPMDVTTADLDKTNKVPIGGDAVVGLNGGTVAVLDPATGDVRAITAEPGAQLTDLAGLGSPKPLLSLGSGAAMAVSQDGTIFAAAPGKLVTIARSGNGFAKPETTKITTPSGARLAVTAVGNVPVVLASSDNSQSASVIMPGGTSTPITGAAGAVLQQAGPPAADVLVATNAGLVSISLGGGQPHTLTGAGTGAPAAPVRFDGCVFAAWAGNPGAYGTSCDGSDIKPVPLADASTSLAFRINRGNILLNDTANGNVWNLDSGPQLVSNWDQVTRPRETNKNQSKSNETTNSTRAQPPKPLPDTNLGARPGRTTSLYVLDNDNDPSGGVLAVYAIQPKGDSGSLLSISPDGQTVELKMPAGYNKPVDFSYSIRGSNGTPASADVSVNLRSPSENAPPTLRRNYTPRTWSVPAGGTVTIPVLGDWRDYTDGDPVVLTDATVSKGSVATTPDGQLVFSAPADAGTQTIDYEVADGMGGTAKGSLQIDVQSSTAPAVAAVAAPDYVRGQVGQPITVQPLANDLPGSDPASPTATLRLAGDVASPSGAPVVTDLQNGTVTVTPTHPGTLSLNYEAAYGYAPTAKGVIEVQVDPAGSDKTPVTAPDTAVLHGSAPVTVDVLANDSDPSGNLLVVQRAVAANPDQLDVSVVDGRYLRLQTPTGKLTPAVQTVEYTVSDGVSGDVTGSVTVTQLPSTDAGPITIDDYATVRSGQAVAVAVLDNDTSPSGSPLSLSKNVVGAPSPGQLVVQPAGSGSAYVSGRLVRFIAPAVTATKSVEVTYQAEDDAGNAAAGKLQITIVPPPSKTNPDQAPQPPPLEGRAIAGQTIRIKVPSSGVDPDGDPVAVTALGAPSKLGRVLSANARGIEYQAYPFIGNGGTDSFSYVVTDSYGVSSTGTVRVAVVTPGDPQPPVAVDDTITTAPGAHVQVDVLANDLVAAGDQVTIKPLSKTEAEVAAGHVKLDSDRGPITVTAGDPKHAVQFFYSITDGVSTSRAQVTVRAAVGENLPPVAFDQYPDVKPGATSVDVDVTKDDYDPDGGRNLTVVRPAGANGATVTLPLTKFPQAVPYVIKDAGGAMASAVIHLPASGNGAPTLKPGSHVSVKSGATTTVDITKYVIDPANKPVRTTLTSTIGASPSIGLTATSKDATHIAITGAAKYNGPAALTFEVTNGTSVTSAGQKSIISLPVQVGDETPVLRCPSTPLQLVQGGVAVMIHPASYCHTWAPDPSTLDSLKFTGAWSKQPAGVSLSGSGSTALNVVAGSTTSTPGATGALTVASGAGKSVLNVVVIKAPNLTVSPITVDGVEAGTAKTVDLTSSLESDLRAPKFAIVGKPTVASGDPATITTSGARMTITPGKDSKGTIRIAYVVTDVPGQVARQVSGVLTLHVLGHPSAPTNVQPGRTVLSKTVSLTWTKSDPNGAPVTRYVVKYNGGQQTCGASPCSITGLTNGRAYTFSVTAFNAVGQSPTSAQSAPATPDAVPTAVQGFTASNPQDHQLTLTWTALSGEFSTVLKYQILGGPTPIETSANTVVARGLENDQQYRFAIFAINKKGRGPSAVAGGLDESAGVPGTPEAPTLSSSNDTANNKRVVTASWAPVDSNGPKPVEYQVQRTSDAGATKLVCQWRAATTCPDPGIELDGTKYTYRVQARNFAGKTVAAGHVSPFGDGSTTEAAATPDKVTNYSIEATGTDSTAKLTFDAPASHGKTSTVRCTRNGDSCGSWTYSPSGQANQTQIVTGFTNGDDTSVSLVDCNGSTDSTTAGAQCGEPVSQNVTTYGPIAPVQLTVTASGTRVNWTYSGNANGKSAHITVRTSKGYSRDWDQSGQFSDSNSEDVGYSYTDTVTVTVTDQGRETRSASGSARSDDPPPKHFEVSYLGGCANGGTCTVYVRITGFVQGGSASCYAAGVGKDNWGPVTFTPDAGGGNSNWVTHATQGNLVDSDGYRFDKGTFDLGHDAGGVTCN